MKMIVAFLVIGFLLAAGCAGGGTPPQTAQPNGSGSPQTGTVANNATPGTPDYQPSGPGTTTPSQPSGGQSLAGLGFEQLIGLGAPVYCTVTMTQGAQTTTSEMWIRGQTFRAETTTPATTEKYVAIMKGDEMFLQMSQEMKQSFAAMGKNCDWLKMAQNNTQQGAPAISSTSDYENLPPTSYQCSPGVFGDEKFATAGTICDYATVFGAIGPQAAPGGAGSQQGCMSACAVLPQDQQAQCFQACAGA